MSQHIKHSLSVSQRLWTLGGAAAVGIGALILVSAYENQISSNALSHAERVREQVEQVVEMRHAHLTMVLAAMDTLVDAQEKAIHPDRIEAWTRAAKTMQEGAPVVKALAKELGLDSEAATYDADAAKLKQLITVDLKNLVEQGAAEAALHQIDDDIDAAGDNMTKMFGDFASRGGDAVHAQLAEATGTASQSLYVQLGTGLLAFLAVIFMQLFHGSSLRRGINGVRHSMNRILNGDYQTSVHSLDRGDEIGEMARATEAFRTAAVEKQTLENQTSDQRRANDAERQARDEQRRVDEAAIKQAVDALATGLERLAGGDITATIDTPFRADLERLRLDFNKTLSELQGVVGEIRSNSLSIQSYGQQMRNSSQDLAKRTEQQAASLEQTSAALGQITDRVRNSTQKARDVGTMVEETRLTSDRSGKVVAEAMSAMERIEDASREIGNIINVIDEIAFQTNLLALNAGVEAARAGEAGKGFAVVAQEVRELAGRAAGAAKDIKALIRKSGEEVRNGVELVTATGEVLRHIGSDVVKISEHVSSIVADAAEQNTGLAEINAAVNQMDQVTQQNAGMVEETSAASHTLAQDADQLINAISRFKVQERNLSYSAPQAVRDTARSQPSPARALVTKVAGAFNRNSSAQRAEPARVSEHWEEF